MKEKRDLEKVPVLEFKCFTKTLDSVLHGGSDTGGGTYWRTNYFAVLKKVRGEGFAKHCEGFLTIEGTNISYAPTVWSHANVRRYDIGGRMDLRLFTVERSTNRIFFPSAHLDQGYDLDERSYPEYAGKDLTIEINVDVAPPKLTKKIEEIIKEAVQEGIKKESR